MGGFLVEIQMDKKSGLKVSEMVEMMERGAVFKNGESTFYVKNGLPLDESGGDIIDTEWNNMTLKTPPPTPEYSREFVQG